PFNGLTDIASHGIIGGQIGVKVQAARYIVLGLTTHFAYVTPHLLTDTDSCTGGVDAIPAGSGAGKDQVCLPGGDPNPHYRGSINAPGNRYRLGGALLVNLSATATAYF